MVVVSQFSILFFCISFTENQQSFYINPKDFFCSLSTFIRKKCSLVHDIEKKRQEKLKSAINDQNRSRVCKTKLNGMNNRNFTGKKKRRKEKP